FSRLSRLPLPRSTLFPYTTLFRSPNGRRNGRSWSGSWRRSDSIASGPEPNDRTVAEVTKPTSFCQPGNGRKKISPTMKVRITLRSEEHTSELQSRENLVCRLLLEK